MLPVKGEEVNENMTKKLHGGGGCNQVGDDTH